jgi:hypothetical protein
MAAMVLCDALVVLQNRALLLPKGSQARADVDVAIAALRRIIEAS